MSRSQIYANNLVSFVISFKVIGYMGGLTSRTSVDPSSTSASMSLRILLFYIHTHHRNNNYHNLIILLYMGGSSIDIMLLVLNVYESSAFRRNCIFARKY